MKYLFLIILVQCLIAQDSLVITYTANEGAIIDYKDSRIYIDSFYRSGGSYGYLSVPKGQLKKMEAGEAPFDKKAIVLVSHPHGDHFNGRALANFLSNNKQAELYSSQQIYDQTKGHVLYQDVLKRMHAITPESKQHKLIDFGDFKIDFLRIRHGYRSNFHLHNLGHIIHIAGKKIIHIGDAEMAEEQFEPFNLVAQKIDIGLLPDWFLHVSDGVDIVKELIKPKHIIAVHVHPKDKTSVFGKIRREFPQADAFTIPFEKRYF